MTDPIEALVFYVAFLFSVTMHEAGHAWAARLGGDLTAYHAGQVSIDPLPHIRREPFGMVFLPVLTVLLVGWPFGYASAPYDPVWARRFPRRAAWMALAGPAANLALILLIGLGIRAGMLAGVLHAPDSVGFASVTASEVSPTWSSVAFVLSTFFSMNLVLLGLNLIPVPPLDGSGALPLLLPARVAERVQEWLDHPMFGLFGILIAWVLFRRLWSPLFLAAVNLLYPELQYG